MGNAPRHCICILGMHRSGTSALAGLLQHLGADLGPNLLPAASDNPKGFFESKRLVGIDTNLHRSLGQRYHSILPLPQGWEDLPVARRFLLEMKDMLASDFPSAPVLALKDPRLCLLYRLWAEALRAAGIAPHPVLILRPPAHVARSLAARDRMAAGHALALWLRYVLEAEANTRGERRIIVSYARVLSAGREVAREIERAFGMAFPHPPDTLGPEADGFLERSMDHSEGDGLPGATDEERDLLRLADALYAALMRPGAAGGETDLELVGKISRTFGLHLQRETLE